MSRTTRDDTRKQGPAAGRRTARSAVRSAWERSAAEIALAVLLMLFACGSLLLLVLGAGGCSSSEDLSPSDGDARGDALGDDGGTPEGSCSAVECTATCRAAGFSDGTCRGAVCRCGSPEGCTLGETTPCYSGPAGTADVGACTMGTATCVAASGEFTEWGPCEGEGRPTAEVCNEIDDDCDGFPDEDLGCLPPGEPCTEGDICLEGQRCIEFPSGRQVCDDPTPCTPTGGECEPGDNCTEFPDGGRYCTEQPGTPRYGCAWLWMYAGDPDPPAACAGPYAAHSDMGGRCRDVTAECTRTPDGHYDCGGFSPWWEWRIVDAAGSTVVQGDFNTQSYGINGAESVEYCVLAWGFHRADAYTSGVYGAPLVFDAGASASFDHRSISIRSDLYDHFEAIDPVVPGTGPSTAYIVWDVSAEALRTAPIPYGYYGLDSVGTCEYEGAPSLEGGAATYEEMVRYVQTVELLPVGIRETGEYNVALAFHLPYYHGLGYRDLALTSALHCYAVDGRVYSWTGLAAIAY